MINPSVTVLMSVCNGEKYLRFSIESVLNQTHRDFEFIIIDDGSNDQTKNIILSYKDSRILLIENQVNIGLSRSLNMGLRRAKGKFIARMDCDDISLSERLEKQVSVLANQEKYLLVGCWTEVIDEEGKTIGLWNLKLSPEEIFYTLHFRNCLTHSGVMFERNTAIELNGYHEGFTTSQDFQFWTRFNQKGGIFQIPEVLVQWRISDRGISRRYHDQQEKFAQEVTGNNIEHLVGKPLGKKFLSIMGDQFDLIENLEREEKKELLKDLRLIHREILRNPPEFIDGPSLNRILNERYYFLSLKLFPSSTSIRIKKYTNRILNLVHN